MEPQTQQQTIEWRAHEHQPIERSSDWFWALGIIAVAAAAASIILGNFLFGLLILVAGITIGILAQKEPRIVTFSLSKKGLAIDDSIYSVNHLNAFWIQEADTGHLLLIDTPRFMTPDLVIPLEGADVNEVRRWFTEREVPERELHESFSLKFLELFGF